MKNLFIVFLLISTKISSQDFSAIYAVSETIYHSDERGKKVVATLMYDGFLYKKKSKYLYYKKPLYLSAYPDGSISVSTNDNTVGDVSICTDTIQGLFFTDDDSLLVRYRDDVSYSPVGSVRYITECKFEPGYQNWEVLTDTKEIAGLKCQKARWVGSNGTTIAEVWFALDIPITHGPIGFMGLPGLVVEGECIPLNQRFVLQSYDATTGLPDTVFSLKELLAPVKKYGPFRKKL